MGLRWFLGVAATLVLLGGWILLSPQHTAVSPALLKAHRAELLTDADSPIGGNPDGDVSLVEFFDYNCPYCKAMVAVLTQAEAADPNLRVVYKAWPILGSSSLFPAKAALAANRQGKFIALHRALYQVRGTLDDDKVLAAAASVGLDVGRLRSDIDDATINQALQRNLALARTLGIDGTPGFVIGIRSMTGELQLTALQAAVRAARGG